MSGRGPLVAVAFAIVVAFALAAGWFLLRSGASAIDAAVAAQAADTREIARLVLTRDRTFARAAPDLVKRLQRPGLRVAVRDRATGIAYTESGFVRRPRGLPAGDPFGLTAPPGAIRHLDRPALLVATLTGVTIHRVAIPGGNVTIAPAADALDATLRTALIALGATFAAGSVALWVYAAAVQREALRPLRETTLSLQRLAQRDFAPRTVTAGRSSAYDDLARAFNAAVIEVAAAFDERRAAEREMHRFIADAGHELRTPLTIVNGYLDIIESGGLSDPAIAGRIIGGMRSEAARMRKMVEKLIVLARMETPSHIDLRAEVDVGALIARVIETLEPLAVSPIVVDAPASALVLADEDDLADAFTNVVENAIKYAPPSAIRIVVSAAGGSVCIDVEDRGPGMTPDDVDHAFERFYRGERRGDVTGSGLGLAIAQRAVERAGGTIGIVSELRAGTTVRIELPALTVPTLAPAPVS